MRTLIAIIVTLACSQLQAWNWMQERGNTNVTCANGQCNGWPALANAPVAAGASQTCLNGQCFSNPLVEGSKSVPAATESLSYAQGNSRSGGTDCPDGRCPLIQRLPAPKAVSPAYTTGHFPQPTLAPPEPRVIVQARPIRSVMVRPVKRLFSGRIIQRIFGRR